MKTRKCLGPCGRELEMNVVNFGALSKGRGGFNTRCRKCAHAQSMASRRRNLGRANYGGLPHFPGVNVDDIYEYNGKKVRISHEVFSCIGFRIGVYPTSGMRKRCVMCLTPKQFKTCAKFVSSAVQAGDAA